MQTITFDTGRYFATINNGHSIRREGKFHIDLETAVRHHPAAHIDDLACAAYQEEQRGALTPEQLAWLRQHVPPFAEMERRKERSRGERTGA